MLRHSPLWLLCLTFKESTSDRALEYQFISILQDASCAEWTGFLNFPCNEGSLTDGTWVVLAWHK